jgi:hypothetical protein
MSKATDTQVVTIGNAFELVYDHVCPYQALPDLARADERHFGQKSTFWMTQYGWPNVVITTAAPSEPVLHATLGSSACWPRFIEPQRVSSSICRDLLSDSEAWAGITTSLCHDKPVFLAPYVHTIQTDNLAAALTSAGYVLRDYQRQGSLVRKLCSKIYADRTVFEPVGELRRHRPSSLIAPCMQSLREAGSIFSRRGIREIVVKSSSAVGGSGIFFVASDMLSRPEYSLSEILVASGQNVAATSGPFLVEERVSCDLSPTVDVEISSGGDIHVVGVALQRLFDDRYYTGFYAAPILTKLWWYERVVALAKTVAARLRSLNYIGPANVDFVISEHEKKITLIELNPRRSALLDGFGLCRMRGGSSAAQSISVTDYVNVAGEFRSIRGVVDSGLGRLADSVVVTADGGFQSDFRWLGIWAGSATADSETLLEAAVARLQDPLRDEIGSATHRLHHRIAVFAA